MRLVLYSLWYHLQNYDEGDFFDGLQYYENVADIIDCFMDDDEFALIPIAESFIKDGLIEEQYEQFIREKIVFTRKEWIYNTPIDGDTIPNFIWYKVKDKDEVINALKFDFLFNCVVIKTGSSINEASFILNANEDSDYNSLSIREKEKGDFEKRVLPKLKKLLGNKLEVADKR
ncbi:hypothetical protein OXPF_10320 [Oxobacter pfennigii]|uniref:Uncharacterized protein n=1 Tax=Oxobacter pfennigii TaxID=36849 RepID=A0A0P8WCD1_9CLOT|nr:hypothetical protein [Oxobacter pfennigii]KPU45385.1 hypothetical protein OXPF_10320 [Oxobacter pfennigii]